MKTILPCCEMTVNTDQEIEPPFLQSTKNTRAILSNFHTSKSQPLYSTGFCGFTALAVVFAITALPLLLLWSCQISSWKGTKKKKKNKMLLEIFSTVSCNCFNFILLSYSQRTTFLLICINFKWLISLHGKNSSLPLFVI